MMIRLTISTISGTLWSQLEKGKQKRRLLSRWRCKEIDKGYTKGGRPLRGLIIRGRILQ